MHGIRLGFRKKMAGKARALRGALRAIPGAWVRYRAGIVYYGAVAAVLIAIALAADGYRGVHAKEETPIEAVQPVMDASSIAQDRAAEAARLAPQLPEGACVLRTFSRAPDRNETLGQWDAHPGMDIRFANDDVPALCAGDVEAVVQDARYGCTVIIRTGKDRMRYMGVADGSVQAGDRVEAGECIARQAERVRCETHLGAHVHIEAEIDGECIDIAPLMQMQ